jgi:hypothetical protein
MKTKTTTPEMVRDAGIALFLADGKDHSAQELADHLGCTVSVVRTILRDARGCVDGLRAAEDHRPSHSRNYRGMETGSHKVWVYGPTRETLRKMLTK